MQVGLSVSSNSMPLFRGNLRVSAGSRILEFVRRVEKYEMSSRAHHWQCPVVLHGLMRCSQKDVTILQKISEAMVSALKNLCCLSGLVPHPHVHRQEHCQGETSSVSRHVNT